MGGEAGREESKRHCVCCLFFPLIASDFADDQPLHSFQSFHLTSSSLLLSSAHFYWSGSTSLVTGSGSTSLTVILFRVDCSLFTALHLLPFLHFIFWAVFLPVISCSSFCIFSTQEKDIALFVRLARKRYIKKCVGKKFLLLCSFIRLDCFFPLFFYVTLVTVSTPVRDTDINSPPNCLGQSRLVPTTPDGLSTTNRRSPLGQRSITTSASHSNPKSEDRTVEQHASTSLRAHIQLRQCP